MQLVSKISAKTVYGSVDIKALHTAKVEKKIIRVIGLASGIKTGETSFGAFVAFTGNFKAINLDTNEEFRSGKVFLPNIAQNLLEGALAQTESDAVEFAFDIGVKPVQDRQGKDSYEYTVTPLMAAQDNDPLAALEGKLNLSALENKADDKAKK